MGHSERSLGNYINHELGKMSAYGESKHEAKKASREAYLTEHGNLKGWNPAKIDGKIFAKETMETYRKAGRHFEKWLKEQGLTKPSQVNRAVASLYLKDRESRGMSAWTVSRDMAMINKVWGYDLNKAEMELKSRQLGDIKRSRGGINPKHARQYEKNANQIEITKACGTRRQSITIIEKTDFVFDKNGMPIQLKLIGDKSEKGGRPRIAPILPAHRQAVKEILDKAPDHGPIFKEYDKNINNHYFRGEYAKELAKTLQEEYTRTGKLNLGGVSLDYLVHLRGKDAKGDGLRYGLNKEVAGAVSGALGHNRISVLKNYLYSKI